MEMILIFGSAKGEHYFWYGQLGKIQANWTLLTLKTHGRRIWSHLEHQESPSLEKNESSKNNNKKETPQPGYGDYVAWSLWQAGLLLLGTTLLCPCNFSLLYVASKTALWPPLGFLPALPNDDFLLLFLPHPCTANWGTNSLAQNQQGKHSAKRWDPQEELTQAHSSLSSVIKTSTGKLIRQEDWFC